MVEFRQLHYWLLDISSRSVTQAQSINNETNKKELKGCHFLYMNVYLYETCFTGCIVSFYLTLHFK